MLPAFYLFIKFLHYSDNNANVGELKCLLIEVIYALNSMLLMPSLIIGIKSAFWSGYFGSSFNCLLHIWSCCSVLFFSRPRSEDWPHHGRTFSIYLCHSDWLFNGESCPRLVLPIQAMHGLPCLHAPGIVSCIIFFSRQLPCFHWP